MTDYEIVIKVLYDLNIAAKNDKSINKKNTAHKYGISRGNVHNILNNYRLSQQEITKYYEQIINHTISAVEDSYSFFPKRTRIRQVKKDDVEVIKECCEKYFNCYLTAEKFLDKMLEHYKLINYKKFICKKRISKLEIMEFNNLGGRYNDQHKAAEEIDRNIKLLKRYRKPPKNYKEVFDEYKKTNSWSKTQIEYSCFYGYAKEYWNEYAMEYWRDINSNDINFGDYIYKNFHYDNKVDKFIKNK